MTIAREITAQAVNHLHRKAKRFLTLKGARLSLSQGALPDDADATGIFMIRRVGTFIFAIMAAALSCVALVDVYLHGQFTLFDPRLLGGLAVPLHHFNVVLLHPMTIVIHTPKATLAS